MKNFASASFFRTFDHHVRPSDRFREGSSWTLDGASWSHTRHFFRDVHVAHSTDVFIGGEAGKRPWALMIALESWWIGNKPDPVRTNRWAHFVSGDRMAAIAWFKKQEVQADR
jgi:hypothetical protein